MKRRKIPKPLMRLANWPDLLTVFIESRRREPFEYGRHDCCLFACDGILAITGLDPAAKMYRGKYHGTLDAARLLKKQGGVEAVAAKVCQAHGFPDVAVNFAQRGDVVLVDLLDQGPALGLCLGGQCAFPGDKGLTFVRTAACRRAWAIGRTVGGNV